MQNFPARWYAKGDGKSLPVTIEVTDHTLLVSNNGSEKTQINLDDIDIRLGGFSDDRVVLIKRSTQDSIVCNDPTFVDLLSNRQIPIELKKQISQTKAVMLTMPAMRLSSWSAALAVLCLLCFATYSTLNLAYSFLSNHIPMPIEMELGRRAFEQYAHEHKLDENSPKAERVARIGKTLVCRLSDSKEHFKFYTVSDDEPNTFSTPGGNIVISSELIHQTKNDDEIAAIIAHEMGHVIKRHAVKTALHGAGVLVTLQAVFSGNPETAANLLANNIRVNGHRFSDQQEKEADLVGVTLSWQSGYDPHALVNLMKRLDHARSQGDDTFVAFTTDHPMTDIRSAHIQQDIAKLETASIADPDSPGTVMSEARAADLQFKDQNYAEARASYEKVLASAESKPVAALYGVWDSLRNYLAILQKEKQTKEVQNTSDRLKNLERKIYTSYLVETLNDNWRPPEGQKPNVVTVYFEIANDGSVSKLSIVRSTGSQRYSDAGFYAVQNASPLLPPPAEIKLPMPVQFTFDYQVRGK